MGEREGTVHSRSNQKDFVLSVCKKVSLLGQKVPSLSMEFIFSDCLIKPLKTGISSKNADTALNTVSKKEEKGVL